MNIGPLVRGLFGRYERQISELYRSIYIDLDAFVTLVSQWQPIATRVLEVGCGEGLITRRLRTAYPSAHITAIDITPRIGRLYGAPTDGVDFICCNVEQIAATHPSQFDLVVLTDVLHHVPRDLRQNLIGSIRTTIAPSGVFVFKDWERTHTPIHWFGYASDRWLTGDRISYLTRMQMGEILAASFGDLALVSESRVRPWRNNIAILVRP